MSVVPRLPVDTEAMPIEAFSVSETLEPRANTAPPPVMPKVLVRPLLSPATVPTCVESWNSTSSVLER
ncbi:hypothetical protein D3C83_253970 [compost metagenome]